MLRFTLKVINAEKLDLAFGGLVAQIKDWRKLWPQVINQIVKIEENQFATMGALGAYGKWDALTRDYAAAKAREYPGKPILQASEHLRDSLVDKTENTIEELEPLKMRFGTRLEYAHYHQTGTRRGMPARRIFDMTEEDRYVIRETIHREAIDFSRRLGFAIARRAGMRDATAAEARRLGVAALAGGPGASLAEGI